MKFAHSRYKDFPRCSILDLRVVRPVVPADVGRFARRLGLISSLNLAN